MVLTPLRESHSARGNQRIYAPKGPPEAISPGGPLQAHRGGMRLTRRPLSRGWGTFLGPRGGWTGCRACSEPRSDPLGHASTAWVGPPSPCVPCSERTEGSDYRRRALSKRGSYGSRKARFWRSCLDNRVLYVNYQVLKFAKFKIDFARIEVWIHYRVLDRVLALLKRPNKTSE